MAAHFERTLPEHRQHLLLSLAKSILTPPAVTCLILYATGPNASAFSATVAMLSIPIFVVLRRSKYALSREDLMTTQLNTRIILRGVGKWPGNIDVAMRIVKSFQNQYFLQGFVDLFDEHKSLTISTHIL
ncbi:hypothetical protein FB446DRAFT_794570 [Lentinula raphanica]|nr:hypothetical protein FB446DRAFT_794570 [Lentinula raphanica]